MVTAKLRHLRISARKVRLIADLIRGKSVGQAENILNFTIKRGAKDILKLLKSAAASARHDFQLEEPNLYIAKITVDDGPKLKRFRPRARGSASEIQKKTSHITIMLDEIEKGKKAATKEEIKKPAQSAKRIEAGPPKSSKAGFGGEKKSTKLKSEKIFKRIFRRKAI